MPDRPTSIWSEDEVGRVVGFTEGMVLVAWPVPNQDREDTDEALDLTRVGE